jgi:hypothetical protein
MPNGAAVALPRELDPAIQPAKAEILEQIGSAVADAAIMVCCAVGQHRAGSGLTGEIRTRAGDLFVAMYQLQQDTLGELDFAAVARVEGKRALWERHGAVMRAQLNYTDATLDAALDELVERPLAVLRQVTAAERAWAN